MKKVFVLFFVFILVLPVNGCGIKQKIEKKIGEKIFESVTDTKIDVDGDKVTVKGEDGTQFSMGGSEWPDSELVKDIPKFEKGTISTVTESDAMVMVIIEGVIKEDYETYREEIKKNFTENTVDMELDNVITFGGGNKKGVFVQIIYNTDDGTFQINASKAEQ